MADPTAQLRKGTLELAVLALLAPGARYGGELIESLAHTPGLNASAGTMYPLLKRLSATGVVVTHWEESSSGPLRKYYKLTDLGRSELVAMRQAWQSLAHSLTTILGELDD